MRVEVEPGSPEAVGADALAAPLPATGMLAGPAAQLDERLGGLLARLAGEGELSGKVTSAPVVPLNGQLAAPRLAIGGVGAPEAIDADALRTAAATVVREAGFAGSIAWLIDESLPLSPAQQARAIVDGTILGAYDPGRWKQDPEAVQIERLILVSADDAVPEAAQLAAVVADWANRARDFVNEPPNVLTPEGLAAHAAEVAAGSPQLTTEAFGLDRIRELG